MSLGHGLADRRSARGFGLLVGFPKDLIDGSAHRLSSRRADGGARGSRRVFGQALSL
jgi:hypothetical protein